MGISENIKRLRTEAGLTQATLADQVGVTRATVTQWETGWSQPRMGMVEKLSEVFGVPLSDIVNDMPETISCQQHARPVKGMDMGYVPLRGRVHAGKPTEPDTYDDEMVLAPQFLVDDDPDLYACTSEGDCMNRVYPEGCIIFVSPNKEPQNGSVAVVTIDGTDTVMRRMYKTPNTLVLSPDSYNTDNKDIIITSENDRTVEYNGKVVWFQPDGEME